MKIVRFVWKTHKPIQRTKNAKVDTQIKEYEIRSFKQNEEV
jgi:hypothetical protein